MNTLASLGLTQGLGGGLTGTSMGLNNLNALTGGVSGEYSNREYCTKNNDFTTFSSTFFVFGHTNHTLIVLMKPLCSGDVQASLPVW